jgi:hypothetical protein
MKTSLIKSINKTSQFTLDGIEEARSGLTSAWNALEGLRKLMPNEDMIQEAFKSVSSALTLISED